MNREVWEIVLARTAKLAGDGTLHGSSIEEIFKDYPGLKRRFEQGLIELLREDPTLREV